MNITDIKEGQTYVCQCDDQDGWTLGKEYKVLFHKSLGLVIIDDYGGKWYLPNSDLMNNVFKLKEELSPEELEQTYTLKQVTKVIIKAYQNYDNDSQRLAFIKGYFAE